MELKIEPSYNQTEIKQKRLISQTQGSAFKPVELPKASSTSSTCSSSSYKFKIDDYDSSAASSFEISSSSSSTSSVSSGFNSNQIPISNQTPMNPFYIDKIFNFQNMYLFPGGNSSGHMEPANNHHNYHSSMPISNPPNPFMLNDLQNLMQQNLLQNFYNYYSSAQNQLSVYNQIKPKEASKAKNNFSIERILSLPSDLKQTNKRPAPQSNIPMPNAKFSRFNHTPIAITAPIPPGLAASIASKQHLTNNSHNNNTKPTPAVILAKEQTQVAPVKSNKNAKKYKCDLCGRGFSRSNTLITHRRIHTGEKPFECNICGRAFRQPGNLTRHKLTHTTIKPYSCNQCGKSFNRVSNLHAHIKIHSDGKPYVCVVCGMSFYQKADLKEHAMLHSSDKIHECSFCKRTFKQAAHLKYHLHSHLKQFDKFDDELKQAELARNKALLDGNEIKNKINESLNKSEQENGKQMENNQNNTSELSNTHEYEDDIDEEEENEEEEDDEEEDDEEFIDEELDEEFSNEIEIENISQNGDESQNQKMFYSNQNNDTSSNSLNTNEDSSYNQNHTQIN